MNTPNYLKYLLLLSWSLCIFAVTYAETPAAKALSKENSAQIKGTPRVIHYTQQDFQGDAQIWTMTQDTSGILYFGNNDGALIFDGERWTKVSLPNNSSVRSLLCSKNGTVYAGGYNEFGKIERNEFGQYTFTSLTHVLRQEDRNFENIWSMHEANGTIIFRSFNRLILLKENQALTIPVNNAYYANVINDVLYFCINGAIQTLNVNTLDITTLLTDEKYKNENIACILPESENQIRIVTKSGHQIRYHLQNQNTTALRQLLPNGSTDLIISGLHAQNGYYYFGSLRQQLITLDEQGKPVTFNKKFVDLQDNTVLNLYETAEGNLWALLNKGIDCINFNSPISTLFEDASVFDAIIHAGRIFMATNQGVFCSEPLTDRPNLSGIAFEPIAGLEGQAWSLTHIEDKIICSHDRGLFVIDAQRQIQQIPDIYGVWKIIPLSDHPNHYFACTYNGLYTLVYENQELKLVNRVEGFNESGRDILQTDNNSFWICHGYKGIFKIKVDPQLERIVSLQQLNNHGIPSAFNTNVFRWNDSIVFTSNHGIYTFHEGKNQFTAFAPLNDLFGKKDNIRTLLQSGQKTWFVQDDELGYFTENNQNLIKNPFLALKGTFNRGLECILPINENHVLIGTNMGLYAFDLTTNATENTPAARISQMQYTQADSLYFLPFGESEPHLPHHTSNFKFDLAAPQLTDQTNVQYSYQLSGLDDNWSDWSPAASKEYAQLYPGKYTFRVKARNMLGETTLPASYTFSVLPVWYRTQVAYFAYLLVFGLVGVGIRKMMNKKIVREKDKTRSEEKEKQKVLELQLQQLQLAREKEMIARDKQQLEEDVIYKSKELANYTMILVKKRELLTEIQEKLKDIKEAARSEKLKTEIRNLTRHISINLKDESLVQVFESNFERVHHEFFSSLRANFPDLTGKDLRLCALIKMDLSNKEIAPILNISVRGVETARYRLRKRLNLDQDENMVEFLQGL